MRYLSTRGGEPVRAAEAIVRGISPSGGLYVPEEYPQIQVETGERGSYQATALRIMQAYFPEAEESALKGMISAAYASFDAKKSRRCAVDRRGIRAGTLARADHGV
jgi:Threonine synthase